MDEILKYNDNLKDLNASEFLTLLDFYSQFPTAHLVRKIIELEDEIVIRDILESYKC
jgi:hypothetical protein